MLLRGKLYKTLRASRKIPMLSHSLHTIEMKLNNNVNPTTDRQNEHEIDDDFNLREFYEKRITLEDNGDALGEEFNGYVFKIIGGCDKQDFPMKLGLLYPGRDGRQLHRGTPCFGGHGRTSGERQNSKERRKSRWLF